MVADNPSSFSLLSHARPCSICHQPIAEERLEILPDTQLCINCARTNPPAPIDPATLDLSRASPINKNGFAPSE